MTWPQLGQKFKANDFRDLRKPGVYLFLLDGNALYVGMGKSLIYACVRTGYHYGRDMAIEQADEVLMYPCVSSEAARELEIMLIKSLRPKYNRMHKLRAIAA